MHAEPLMRRTKEEKGSVCGTWGKILFQVLDMGDTQLVKWYDRLYVTGNRFSLG